MSLISKSLRVESVILKGDQLIATVASPPTEGGVVASIANIPTPVVEAVTKQASSIRRPLLVQVLLMLHTRNCNSAKRSL